MDSSSQFSSFVEGIVVCIALLSLFWIYRHTRTKVKGIPGPFKWPIIGNALQINLRQPHLSIARIVEKYGPVVHLKVLHWDIVVLSSADAILEATIKRGSDFAGRPDLFRAWFSTFEGQDIIFQTSTTQWANLRKSVHRSIKSYGSNLSNIELKLQHEAAELVDALSDTNQAEREFVPYDVIYRTLASVLLCLLIGQRVGKWDETLGKVEEFDHIFNECLSMGKGVELDVFPWLRYLPNKTFSRLTKACQIRNDVLFQLFKDYKKHFEEGEEDGLVGELLRQRELHLRNEQDDVITEASIIAAMGDMLVAGSDSTSTNIVCLLANLANNPAVQARVQEEIDAVIGRSRPPCLSDQEAMPYVGACILESLRYASITPLSIPHATVTDTQVQGYSIPRGTQVWMNLWSLHHSAKTWHEPFTFNPSRFLDEHGKLVPAGHPVRHNLQAFGAGRRVCLGETLAKYEMFILTVSLLQRFTFLPGEGAAEAADPRTFMLGVILHPNPFTLVARKHAQ